MQHSAWRDTLLYTTIFAVAVFTIAIFADLSLANAPSSDYTFANSITGHARIVTPFLRFDAGYYLHIALSSYDTTALKAFFPMFPLLIGLLGYLFHATSPVSLNVVATLVNFGLLTLAIYWLYQLFQLDTTAANTRVALALLLAAPFAFFYLAPYSEALLLCLGAGALLAARRGHWWLASIAAAFASATRLPGALLFPVLVVEYGSQIHWDYKRLRTSVCWLLLAPLGIMSYFFYLFTHGGITKYFDAYRQSWPERHATLNIFGTLWSPIGNFLHGHGLSMNALLALASFIIAVLILVLAWQQLRASYRWLIVLSLLLPLLSGSLDSLGRYYGAIFPLYLGSTFILTRFKLDSNLPLSTLAMVQGLMITLFVNGYFVG